MPTGAQTFYVMNPDGTIAFTFKGIIEAEGVDLPASDSLLLAPPQSLIRWLNLLNQPVVHIFGAETGGGAHVLRARALQPDDPQEYSEFTLHVDGSLQQVRFNLANAGIPTGTFVLLESNDRSQALRLPRFFIKNARDYFGRVTDAGAISAPGSEGWTVARTALGSYTVTISDGDVTSVYPTATVHAPAAGIRLEGITARTFSLRAYTTTGVSVDSPFDFHARALIP